MSAISSVASQATFQAPPAATKPAPQKVDSDGDHDNSPPSEAKSSSRPLNVVA